jgi:hypothetical protein
MSARLYATGIKFEFKELEPVIDGKCDTNDPSMISLVEKYLSSGLRMPIIDVDGVLMNYPEAARWVKLR